MENLIVAGSNLVYIWLALWLFYKGQKAAGVILVAVALTSIVFHMNPDNNHSKILDVVVANLAIALTLLIYWPRWQEKNFKVDFNISLAFLSALFSVILFFSSGSDHDSTSYVVVHSLWHIFTALAAYLFIKETM